MFTIDPFTAWLLAQAGRPDPIGDLATTVAYDLAMGGSLPIYPWSSATARQLAWRNYLVSRPAGRTTLDALAQACAEFADLPDQAEPNVQAEPCPAARSAAGSIPHTVRHRAAPSQGMSAVHYRPHVDAETVLAEIGQAAVASSPTHGSAWHAALHAADSRSLELMLTAALVSWLADNDLLPGTWPAAEPAPESAPAMHHG